MKLFIALYQNPEENRDVIWYLAKDRDHARTVFLDELQNSECVDEEEAKEYSLEALYEVSDLYDSGKKYQVALLEEGKTKKTIAELEDELEKLNDAYEDLEDAYKHLEGLHDAC